MSETPTNPAEVYEQYFGPAMFAPSAKLLLELAAPRPGERVLDLACGSGQVTRLLPPLVGPSGTVVGIDPSPHMLAVARGLPSPAGASITWKEGNAVTLDEPDASFDLVTIQHGFQFFPDKAAAARHLRRVLAPRGRLVLSVWQGLDRHPLVRKLFEAEAVELNTPAEVIATPFSLGDASVLRDILAAAGFGEIEIVERAIEARFTMPEQYVRLSAIGSAAVLPQFASIDRETFVANVSKAVGAEVARHTVDGHVVMTMRQNLAIARVA